MDGWRRGGLGSGVRVKDGSTHGRTDGRIDERADAQMDRSVDKGTDGWTKGRMHGMDGRNDWMDGRTGVTEE